MTIDHPSVAQRVEQERQLLIDLFARFDKGELTSFDLDKLARGCLGVVVSTQPITWEELKDALAVGTEEAMGMLGRSPLALKHYYSQQEAIRKQFSSVTDYLYSRVFSVPTALLPDGRKVAVVPPDFSKELQIVWRDNDFPYHFEEGLEHHNVWASRPLSQEELQQVITENRQGYETLTYVNPPPLMSVPTIWHAHIISRRLPSLP